MTAVPPLNRAARRAQARAAKRAASRQPGLRTVREIKPADIVGAAQEFIAGAAFALATAKTTFTRPDGTSALEVTVIVPPPDERLDELFAWRQRLDEHSFLHCGWQARARWGTFGVIPDAPPLARLDLDFHTPQRFAYRIIMFADQAIPALELAASGNTVVLAQPDTMRAARCANDLTANALPVATNPSPALQMLLQQIREQQAQQA